MPIALARAKRLFAGQDDVSEFRIVRKDGESHWLRDHGHPIWDEIQGRVVGIYGAAQDITERKRAEQALQESEAWFRTLADTTSTTIFIYQGERFVYANRAAERLSGYSSQELLNLRFWDVVHPEHRELIRQRGLARQRGEAVPERYEFKIIRKDGAERWLDFTAGKIDWQGQPAAIGTAIDITERVQAEEALRQSEERYRNYIELANDFIFTLDSNGQITSANKAMRQMLGYTATELLGKSALEFVAPEARAIAAEALSRTLRGEDIPHIELPLQTGDNRQLILEIRGVTLYRGQEITGTLHIARDITERVKAEQALRESESILKEAQRLGRIGHWELDLETRQIRWSDMVFAIYERDPSLGAPTPEEEATYYSPEDAERLRNYSQKTIETGEPYETDVRLNLPGGRFAVVAASGTPVKDAHGRVVRLLGTVQDITRRKQAEAQLRLQNTALESSANAIVITDPQGFIQWANPAFTALTGYVVPDEILGRNPRELVKSGKQDKRFYKKLWDTILAGKVWRGELINRRKDGRLYDEEMTITPVKSEAGEISHFIAVKQDITPRKRREREMEAMLRVSQAIGGLTELQPLLESLLEAAVGAIPSAEKGTILLADAEGGLQIRSMNGYRDQRVLGYRFPLTSSYAARAFRERRPLIIRDAQADPNTRYDGEIEEIGAIRSAIIAPLVAQKCPIGVISLDSTRSGEETFPQSSFTEDDLRLLFTIAAAGGVAIENVRLFEKTEQRLQQLTALHTVDRAISSSLDLRMILNVIAEQAVAQLQAEAAAVLLFDQRTLTLEYAAGYGFRQRGIEQSRVSLGTGLAGRSAFERRTLSAPHLSHEDSSSLLEGILAGEGFLAHHVTPLIAKGEVKGVLEVYHRAAFTPQAEWIGFFEAIATQAAIAIDNAQLLDSLQRSSLELSLAYSATIEGWAKAMEMRDKETEGHTLRVAELTLQLAQILGVTEDEIVHIRRGALLHDIGKIGVPDSILRKPGKLNAAEWEIMRRHPQSAYEMLQPI